MPDGTFVRADIDQTTGAVSILRNVNGVNWRRAIARGDSADLDATAPELPPALRAGIAALWDALGPSAADDR
jgi:hypothetical protein